MFWGSKEFAILPKASYLTIQNTVFMGITSDVQGHASCVHFHADTVHFGTYMITNTSFINCVTEDFGVMNVPNVALNMSDVTIIGCNSTDSDQHLHAHCFMITDNDELLLPVFITNCVFELNDAANGGTLYIDRKQKNIILTGCVFRNNRASYQAESNKYGVNLQEGTGKITITKCKFIFNKANDASNARFQGLNEIILENNCFISNGNGNTSFHKVSDTIITFTGNQHCFNQKGNYNFQLAAGQNIPDTVKYTCDEYCVPADTYPTERVTKPGNDVLNLVRCTFNGVISNLDGGVAYLRFFNVLNIIDSTFTNCQSNNSGGVIFTQDGESRFYNSKFTECEDRLYAGTIYGIGQSVFEVDNCVFTKCRSKRVSGLMYSFIPDYEPGNDEEENPQNASISNCQFVECYNTAAEEYYLDYYCALTLDFDQESTVANATVINCSFNNNKGFGILSELTYVQLVNTIFTNQNNDKAGNHASCVHYLTETVHFGAYTIKNTTFVECVTDDYGVMNVPNVILVMRDCLVSKCTSTDVDGNITAHGFMITDDDLLEQIIVINCVFSDNKCANGGALYINRKLKNVIVEKCQFSNNKATFDSKADTYGANLKSKELEQSH